MVADHCIDLEDDSGHLWIRAWRCVCCGDIIDSLIRRRRLLLRSRLASQTELVTSPTSEDEGKRIPLSV
ncbi:MAG: hypothetical protein C4293_15760 [Nitrospiraceae bacterium]